MDISTITDIFDSWTDNALGWISDNGEWLFESFRAVLEGTYDGVLWLLQLAPFYVIAIIAALLGWRLINAFAGILAGLAMIFCAVMGLWSETMSTLALVITATILALLFGIPIGIVAGFVRAFDRFLEPILDLIQTMPPYIIFFRQSRCSATGLRQHSLQPSSSRCLPPSGSPLLASG